MNTVYVPQQLLADTKEILQEQGYLCKTTNWNQLLNTEEIENAKTLYKYNGYPNTDCMGAIHSNAKPETIRQASFQLFGIGINLIKYQKAEQHKQKNKQYLETELLPLLERKENNKK